MKINGNEIRPGYVVEHEGTIWVAVRTQAVKPGKGPAYNQVELKGLLNGGTKLNQRFRASETVERVRLEQRTCQYLYPQDENNLVFMDTTTYDQITLSNENIGDGLPWLTENMELQVEFYESTPVSVALPDKIEAEVAETEAVVKGQTASASFKPAKLTNGATVQVPPYITPGDRIVVSTSEFTFYSRA